MRRVTYQRSPRGGRLRHVVEDPSVDDLDEPAGIDVEQEHRAVHPTGIGKTRDQRDARAVRVAHLPHLTGGRDPRELPQPVGLLPHHRITPQRLPRLAQRRLRDGRQRR